MKLLKIVCTILFVLFLSCNTSTKPEIKKEKKQLPVIVLQPLLAFDKQVLLFLKDSIETFYPVQVVITAQKSFPENCYYKPRNRYRADSTIKWLKNIKPDSVRLLVGITDADISTSKGLHKDFGVMGLGYKPGGACVISTVRLKKTAATKEQLRQRIFKVVVHEMGHNFGLDHCPDEQCIMVDAEGKMKLDAEKDLCASCRKKLNI